METMKTNDVAAAVFKQQSKAAVAVLDAITEGWRKLQEAQLRAAAENRAAVEGMHKRSSTS